MCFKIQKFIFISLIIFSLCNSPLFAQTKTQEQIWVDSVYNSLNLNQRIAQLLVVRANQSGEGYFKDIRKHIKNYNIGGITFFKNSPTKQALITNHWQSLSKTPLLISIDGEYGVWDAIG